MAGREDFFVDGGADGVDGFVDDLTEAELEGDATKNVGLDGFEAPAGDEEIDHAAGSVAGSGDQVFATFDDDPGVAVEVWGYAFGGLNEGPGEGLVFMDPEAEGGIKGALDAVDADFAVTLGSVAVAATEEGTRGEHGEVEFGSGAEFADVEIAAEVAGRAGAEGAVFSAGDAHHSEKRAEGEDGGGEGAGDIFVKLPLEEIGVGEAFLQKAEAGDDAGPAPAVVMGGDDFDFEDVAGFGVLDPDGSGEGVDAGAVDALVLFEGHGGVDLAAAGVLAIDVDHVVGGDAKTGFMGPIPDGVGGFGGEEMFAHGATVGLTRTSIWSSTRAWRGRALTPTEARTCLPGSPKSWTRRSEAPLMTAGGPSKPATQLT